LNLLKTIVSIVLICALTVSSLGGVSNAFAPETPETGLYEADIIDIVDVDDNTGDITTDKNEDQYESSSDDYSEDGCSDPEASILEVLSNTQNQYDAIEQFISRLYTLVVRREYSAAEIQAWAEILRSRAGNGGEVAFGFFFSPEFIGQKNPDDVFVEILYRTLLNRVPSPDEVDRWVGFLELGWPREDVFMGFVNSIEFDNLCAQAGIERGTYRPPPGGLIHVFVTRLYLTTLGRGPDSTGLSGWVSQLLSGVHGAAVAYGFIFSTEMEKRNLSDEEFVEILYEALMGRASDPAGLVGWLDVLDRGITRRAVFEGFVYSIEFDNICKEYGIVLGRAPSSLAGKVIILDPGHGTSGSPGMAGYNEAVAMLGLARRIRPLLEAQGAEVILTRDSETNYRISARCAMINIRALEAVRSTKVNINEINEINRLIGIMQSIVNDPVANGNTFMNVDNFLASRTIHPDLRSIFEFTNAPIIRDNFLVISLHSNATAGGTDGGVRGAEAYYIDPNVRANTMTYYPGFSFTEESRTFGNIILNHIQNTQLSGTSIPRRINGLRAENYAMIREINVPAVLVENGFHTNATDRALLSDPVYMDRLAEAYLHAIQQYFS
jgi:N-acetylmuramoyl-L-alanine amidase